MKYYYLYYLGKGETSIDSCRFTTRQLERAEKEKNTESRTQKSEFRKLWNPKTELRKEEENKIRD